MTITSKKAIISYETQYYEKNTLLGVFCVFPTFMATDRISIDTFVISIQFRVFEYCVKVTQYMSTGNPKIRITNKSVFFLIFLLFSGFSVKNILLD